MKHTSGIYKITCIANGNYYYGSATHIHYRWTCHKKQLREGVHDNKHMLRTWNKHGEASFIFEIDMECPIDKLKQIEQVYLDIYVGRPGCMNISKFADAPMRGRKHTVLSRQKMSEYAKNKSPEHLHKISESLKGKKRSAEICQKISEYAKNKSPEHRREISKANKGRVWSAEAKQHMSDGHYAYWAKKLALQKHDE